MVFSNTTGEPTGEPLPKLIGQYFKSSGYNREIGTSTEITEHESIFSQHFCTKDAVHYVYKHEIIGPIFFSYTINVDGSALVYIRTPLIYALIPISTAIVHEEKSDRRPIIRRAYEDFLVNQYFPLNIEIPDETKGSILSHAQEMSQKMYKLDEPNFTAKDGIALDSLASVQQVACDVILGDADSRAVAENIEPCPELNPLIGEKVDMFQLKSIQKAEIKPRIYKAPAYKGPNDEFIKNSIAELVYTEKNYVEKLRIFHEQWCTRVRSDVSKWDLGYNPALLVKKIAPDFTVFLNAHQRLIDELHNTAKPGEPTVREYFQAYMDYIVGVDQVRQRYLKHYRECEESRGAFKLAMRRHKRFALWFEGQLDNEDRRIAAEEAAKRKRASKPKSPEEDSAKDLDEQQVEEYAPQPPNPPVVNAPYNSLVAEPVQRLPRYTVIFGNILQHMEPENPDYELVLNAAKMTDEIGQNNVAEETDDQEIFHLIMKIGAPANLVRYGRKVVTGFDVRYPKSRETLTLLICDDIVIITRPPQSKDVERPFSHYRFIGANQLIQLNGHTYKGYVELKDIDLLDVSEDEFKIVLRMHDTKVQQGLFDDGSSIISKAQSIAQTLTSSGKRSEVREDIEILSFKAENKSAKTDILRNINHARVSLLMRKGAPNTRVFATRFDKYDYYFNVFQASYLDSQSDDLNKSKIAVIFCENEEAVQCGFDAISGYHAVGAIYKGEEMNKWKFSLRTFSSDLSEAVDAIDGTEFETVEEMKTYFFEKLLNAEIILHNSNAYKFEIQKQREALLHTTYQQVIKGAKRSKKMFTRNMLNSTINNTFNTLKRSSSRMSIRSNLSFHRPVESAISRVGLVRENSLESVAESVCAAQEANPTPANPTAPGFGLQPRLPGPSGHLAHPGLNMGMNMNMNPVGTLGPFGKIKRKLSLRVPFSLKPSASDSSELLVGLPDHEKEPFQILKALLVAIECKYLHVQGLYRVAAPSSDFEKLWKSFQNKTSKYVGSDSFAKHEAHVLTNMFKRLVEEKYANLLFTQSVREKIFEAMEQRPESMEEMMTVARNCIKDLPTVNFAVLRLVFAHLKKVSESAAQNGMTASDLAKTLARTFFGSSEQALASCSILEHMITHNEPVFSPNTTDILGQDADLPPNLAARRTRSSSTLAHSITNEDGVITETKVKQQRPPLPPGMPASPRRPNGPPKANASESGSIGKKQGAQIKSLMELHNQFPTKTIFEKPIHEETQKIVEEVKCFKESLVTKLDATQEESTQARAELNNIRVVIGKPVDAEAKCESEENDVVEGAKTQSTSATTTTTTLASADSFDDIFSEFTSGLAIDTNLETPDWALPADNETAIETSMEMEKMTAEVAESVAKLEIVNKSQTESVETLKQDINTNVNDLCKRLENEQDSLKTIQEMVETVIAQNGRLWNVLSVIGMTNAETNPEVTTEVETALEEEKPVLERIGLMVAKLSPKPSMTDISELDDASETLEKPPKALNVDNNSSQKTLLDIPVASV